MPITTAPVFTNINVTDYISNGPGIINANFAKIVAASELSAGVTQIATVAEALAATEAYKYITPSTLNTFVTTNSGNWFSTVNIPVSASQAEVNAGQINTKFVTPQTLKINLDIFLSNYRGSQTYNYTGSIQTFDLIANNVNYFALVCIGGGGGGAKSGGNGQPGDDSIVTVLNAGSNYYNIACGTGGYGAISSTGGKGGDGTIGGNGGDSLGLVRGDAGLGKINGYDGNSASTQQTLVVSPYISITNCQGGGTSLNGAAPGGGGGSDSPHGNAAGGGAGVSIVFGKYYSGTATIDESLLVSTVKDKILNRLVSTDGKLYITVGPGGTAGGGGGNTGENGRVVLYYW
jgi:hypothetical protein